MSILKQHRPRYCAARTAAVLAVVGATGLFIACANPVPRDPAAQPSQPVEMRAPGDPSAENSAIRVSDPEPTLPVDPVPDAAPPVALAPETIGPQELECNPGNSVVIVRRSGEWTVQRRVDGMRLCMRSRGNGETVYDVTGLEGMDDDSWLVLESQAERLHRLVITPGPSGLEHDWSIDGRSQAFDAEAEEWRDLMLTVMEGYLEAQEVRGDEARLRGEIASHRGQVVRLRGVIASHRGHVASLQGRIASHRGHVATLRGQIASRRGRVVAALRNQMGLASRQRAMRTATVRMHEVYEAARQAMEAVEMVEAAKMAMETADVTEALEAARQATESVELRVALEAANRAMEAVDVTEALEAATQALESVELRVATEAARRAMEAVDSLWVPETLSEVVQQIMEHLRVLREDTQQLQGETEGIARDLDARLAELEVEIAEYDLDGKVGEIEAEIEQYDLDGRVREIDAEIEQYDLDGKIRGLEAQIEELDADQRIDEIERSLQDEIAAIRRLIG